MVAFSKIKAGDVLFDCHRQKIGNTTMSRMACWPARVLSINPETRSAMVSWNGNAPRRYNERDLGRLRRTAIKGAS